MSGAALKKADFQSQVRNKFCDKECVSTKAYGEGLWLSGKCAEGFGFSCLWQTPAWSLVASAQLDGLSRVSEPSPTHIYSDVNSIELFRAVQSHSASLWATGVKSYHNVTWDFGSLFVPVWRQIAHISAQICTCWVAKFSLSLGNSSDCNRNRFFCHLQGTASL